jgi:NDP-sugar pyrophosphorylase family protein
MMMDLPAKSVTAIVMAGGKGTRLRPFTTVLPKPLVPIGDMSIIEIVLRRLAAFGFENVVVSTGYLAELIMAVAGDGSKYGLNVEYSHEAEPLGTAGALGLIDNSSDPVMVLNGDLLTTLNFQELLNCHSQMQADVTIATHRREVKIDFGVVEADRDGNFISFAEKPTYNMDVSMGVNVLSRKALEQVKPGVYLDMPDLILETKATGGKVYCFNSDCYWLDIGRVDDYGVAQDEFEDRREEFLGCKP